MKPDKMEEKEKTEKEKEKEKEKKGNREKKEKTEKEKEKDKKQKTEKDKDKEKKVKGKEATSPQHIAHTAHAPVSHSHPPPEKNHVASTPKPTSYHHQDPSPGHSTPTAESSHVSSKPKPTGSHHRDPSPRHPSPSAENSHETSTPKPTSPRNLDSSPGLPSPSDSHPAQDGMRSAHGTDSNATQASNLSDRHEAPSATSATSATGTEAQRAALPDTSKPRLRGLLSFDEDLSQRLAICTDPTLTFGRGKILMKTIARAGTSSSWLIWIPVMIISTQQSSLREQLVNLYRGVFWTSFLVLILRLVCRRHRPSFPGGRTSSPSAAGIDRFCFPSGSCALAMLACCFIAVNYRFDGLVMATVATTALLVAASAVTLGRHYVLDVLAGWVIGLVMYQMTRLLWVPAEQCERYIRHIHDALHL